MSGRDLNREMPKERNSLRTMELPTVSLNEQENTLEIIDQTLLPNQVCIKKLKKIEDIHKAIYRLEVRGAPAIGVAAAIGLYVSVLAYADLSDSAFCELLQRNAAYLESARPTAVNLSWAIQRMLRAVNHAPLSVREKLEILHRECIAIWQEDIAMCRSIGENALSLLTDGCGILTHCNAGQLATSKYGTALSPIHLGAERGMHFRVYADETRPLLQGARLTAFELQQSGVEVTLICDNMASYVMKNGLVDAVLVGCDRVVANGDACNKIGTSGVAVLAHYYGIPFYVLGPTSTIDMSLLSGDQIPIERRPDEEVTELWYQKRMAPDGIKVLNPAFDVTDHRLITAIITEKGILYPPFDRSLQSIF